MMVNRINFLSGVAIAVFGIVLVYMAVLVIFNDSATSRYATMAEAHADQLFDRGWLPEILPGSTANIEINNNLDLNSSWGSFEISPDDLDAFKGHLYLISYKKYFYSENRQAPGWEFTIDDVSGHVEYTLN
jgi:hypothetical protein